MRGEEGPNQFPALVRWQQKEAASHHIHGAKEALSTKGLHRHEQAATLTPAGKFVAVNLQESVNLQLSAVSKHTHATA